MNILFLYGSAINPERVRAGTGALPSIPETMRQEISKSSAGTGSVENEHFPMVSIGVPAYNAGKTIGAMIKSVLAQSSEDWELLIADDGSTDDTVRVAASFKDPRIRIFSDGKNLKISARLNQLTGLARGKFFARMDADDEMLPDRIARQVAYLTAHPEVDVLGGGAVIIDENGKITGTRNIVPAPVDTAAFIHPSVMGKTEWFRANRYDERFNGCEDMELWRRARRRSVFRLLDGAVIRYRDSETLNLKKYFWAQRQNFRVALFGDEISITERAKLIAGTALRCGVAICAVLFGQEKTFIARRNSPYAPNSDRGNS